MRLVIEARYILAVQKPEPGGDGYQGNPSSGGHTDLESASVAAPVGIRYRRCRL
jgi:hypothetical protein